jgi:hypothetical protein
MGCDGGLTVMNGCTNGVCNALNLFKCDAGSCASGNACVAQGFPRCTQPISGACYSCDPLTSDRCTVVGGCSCGSAAACTGNTTCLKTDGGYKCLPYVTGN